MRVSSSEEVGRGCFMLGSLGSDPMARLNVAAASTSWRLAVDRQRRWFTDLEPAPNGCAIPRRSAWSFGARAKNKTVSSGHGNDNRSTTPSSPPSPSPPRCPRSGPREQMSSTAPSSAASPEEDGSLPSEHVVGSGALKILPGTARHLLPDGRVTLLGAIDTVTGAMTLVETGGKGLLVDCGIAQGQAARDWRF